VVSGLKRLKCSYLFQFRKTSRGEDRPGLKEKPLKRVPDPGAIQPVRVNVRERRRKKGVLVQQYSDQKLKKRF